MQGNGRRAKSMQGKAAADGDSLRVHQKRKQYQISTASNCNKGYKESNPRGSERKEKNGNLLYENCRFFLARLRGFEPPTYRLGGGRSILLSYKRIDLLKKTPF